MGRNRKSKSDQKKDLEDNLEQNKKLDNNLEQQKELEATNENLTKTSENLEHVLLDLESSLSTEAETIPDQTPKTKPKTSLQEPEIKKIPIVSDVIISQYAYDQTEKNIKILVEMPGIGGYPKDEISLTASEFSFRFYVKEFDNKNWLLVVHCLAHEIIPSDVDFIVKKDKVTLVLPKKNHFKWVCLTPTEETLFQEWAFSYCETIRLILGQYVNDIEVNGIWKAVNNDRHILRNGLLDPIVYYENKGLFPRNLNWKTLEDVINYAKKIIREEPSRIENCMLLGSSLLMSLEQRNKRLDEVKYVNIKEKVTQLPDSPDEKLKKSNPEAKAIKPFAMGPSSEPQQDARDPKKTIVTTPLNLGKKSFNSVTERLVAGLEKRGQSFVDDKQYQSVIEIFTEIMDLIPDDSVAYSRRADCYSKLNMLQEALDNGRMALLKNPEDFEECRLLVGESSIALGKPRDALETFQKAKKFDSGTKIVKNLIAMGNELRHDVENAEETFNNEDFNAAAAFYETAIKSSVSIRVLQLKAAECLILANKTDEVNKIVENLAEGRITESDALCIQGMLIYYKNIYSAPEAFDKFEVCLSLEKAGHEMCTRYYKNAQKVYFLLIRGNYHFDNNRYIIALEMYNRGLIVDAKNKAGNSLLHYKIALTNLKLLNVLDAIDSLTIAISFDKENYEAVETRAKCYLDICELQNALEDLEIVYKRNPLLENKKLLEETKAKLQLKPKCSNEFSSLSKEEQNKIISLQRKEKGNQLFSKKCYNDAIDAYSEAISLDPKCAVNFSNRSACYLVMKKPLEALADASKSLEMDENFIKGYLRKGKAKLMLGKGEEALRTFSEGLELDPSNKNLKIEWSKASDFIQDKTKAEEAFRNQEFIAAKTYFGKALDAVGDCSEIIAKYVEVWLYCGENDYNKISELKGRLRSDDPNSRYIVALETFYFRHNIVNVGDTLEVLNYILEDVIRVVESVLSQDPNHSKAKNLKKKVQKICKFCEGGKKARANNNLAEAIALFQKVLLVDEYNKKFNALTLCVIGDCYMMQKDFLKAIEQFKLSIELNDRNTSPYIRRALCYDHIGLWQESVNDYEKAFNVCPSLLFKKLLDDASVKLKKNTRKDYYKVLGLDSDATMEAIKKAYNRLAKEHYPDLNSTEEGNLREQEKFKEINEAYNILSDPLKRERYDRGDALNNDQNFNDPFNNLFGLGGLGGQFNPFF